MVSLPCQAPATRPRDVQGFGASAALPNEGLDGRRALRQAEIASLAVREGRSPAEAAELAKRRVQDRQRRKEVGRETASSQRPLRALKTTDMNHDLPRPRSKTKLLRRLRGQTTDELEDQEGTRRTISQVARGALGSAMSLKW